MDLDLKGKIALVLGSSDGLGKAVAESLAKEGVVVVISARNEEKLKKAKILFSTLNRMGHPFQK